MTQPPAWKGNPGVALGALLCACCLAACTGPGRTTAILLTDRPEFALYAAYFNSVQDTYRIETRYVKQPAQHLDEVRPDMVAGSWLKSAATRNLFVPLDSFLIEGGSSDGMVQDAVPPDTHPVFTRGIVKDAFYPRLLALGAIDGDQYLLPVSFDIPALVFVRTQSGVFKDPFTVSLEDIQALGKSFNRMDNGSYTRMGFSPRWDNDFLMIVTALCNTGFRETLPDKTSGQEIPVTWNQEAWEHAIQYLRNWTTTANTSIQAEDDFVFKYLYEPPVKLAIAGRILCTYMGSAAFFTLSADQRASLDFRWISSGETIPVEEQSVYYGIYKKGPARNAAEAFTRWFFQGATQKELLERIKTDQLADRVFGIGGGFSAMRTVTEQVFPQFYPGLLGHMPPEAFVSPPNILPRDWTALKAQVIIPYLRERIDQPAHPAQPAQPASAVRGLEKRIADWYRVNGQGTAD